MRTLWFGAVLASTSLLLLAGETTGWRSFRNAMYPDATPPTHWGKDTNVAWRTPIAFSGNAWGHASPIVVGDRIFVSSEKCNVLCISLKDGSLLWTMAQDYADIGVDAPEKQPPTHDVNGYASATLASDGERVFFLTGLGTLAAYSLEGKRLWARDLPHPAHGWGHSASPIFVNGNLIIHIGGHLMALNPATGETVWDVTGAPEGTWGTPVVLKAKAKTVIVTAGGDWFDAADGTKIAENGIQRFPWGSPVEVNNVVYHLDEHAEEGASAYTINDDGTPKKLWVTKIPKERHYASPIIHEGLLYNTSANGRLVVMDIADGAIVYEKMLDFGKMTAYPSPFFANGLIYVSGDSGVTFVIKPGREYAEVARNEFTPFRATPLAIGKRLIIRTREDLTCLE